MSPMMESIINAAIGGSIIGLSASMLLLFKGKIFGVSGILGMSLGKINADGVWRLFVLAGLVTGSWAVYAIAPQYFDYEVKANLNQSIVAGLLVGFGTRLGSGCTSGHGICGLPRFSKRSFAAVMTFMLAGGITVKLLWS
jgi:uncharacterized membrane protein YedE/YeeE